MSPAPHYDKVLAALRSTLKHDSDEHVRSEAAKGLAKLDVQESTTHEEHEELDDTLISALQGEQKDTSSLVRSEVAKGLLEVEMNKQEEQHKQLDNGIFR